MNSIVLFGITFNINPIAFTVPGINWSVYWYGIFIATGVLLALWYGMKNAERFGMNPDHIFNTFIVTLPCCVIGARAYYLLFDGGISEFKYFFDFSGKKGFSGLAIYGGIIMAAICIFVFQRVYKFSVLAALDITSVGLFIGQAIGRWGNFVNQEAYGTFTGSSWFGMTGNVIESEMGSGLVHPCFLYESVWCLLGFFLLNHFSKKRIFKGQIALMYGMWYGFERCFVELLRTDSLMLGSIRVSSMLSAVICIGCTVTLTLLLKKYKQTKTPQYDPQFAEVNEMTVNSEEIRDSEPEKTASDDISITTDDEMANKTDNDDKSEESQ